MTARCETARPRSRPTCASARASSGSARSARAVLLALARLLELLLGDSLASASRSARSISAASCSASRCRIPPAQPALDLIVDHLRQAAELPPDRLGLAHQHLEHPVLDPLRKHEVVAADLVRRLQLAVDAPVALLDSPRVPRQVEVEQVGAVRLEVQALPRGVGRDQDPQRILRRVGVEPALDLLAQPRRSSGR